MGLEAVHLLVHVQALGQQGQFLLQAIGVQFGADLSQPIEDALTDLRHDLGHALADRGDAGQQAVAALADEARQALTLPGAAGDQGAQGLVEQGQGLFLDGSQVRFLLFQDPGPAQQIEGFGGRRPPKPRAHLGTRREQQFQVAAVDAQLARDGGGRGEAQAGIHLAAVESGADALAHRHLQGAQVLGQADEGLQEAVIDGAQLPGQFAQFPGQGLAGEGGHTFGHGLGGSYRGRGWKRGVKVFRLPFLRGAVHTPGD